MKVCTWEGSSVKVCTWAGSSVKVCTWEGSNLKVGRVWCEGVYMGGVLA